MTQPRGVEREALKAALADALDIEPRECRRVFHDEFDLIAERLEDILSAPTPYRSPHPDTCGWGMEQNPGDCDCGVVAEQNRIRAEAIEECAKIAEQEAEWWGHKPGSSARVAAARIRALISRHPAPPAAETQEPRT